MRPARALFSKATIAAVALLALAAPAAPAAVPGEPAAVPGEVIARFEAVGKQARGAALESVGSRGGRSLTGLPGVRTVELPAGEAVAAAVRELRAQPGVAWAEPNYVGALARLPDDPRLGELWGLRNVGQAVEGTAGLAGIDVGAPTAWERATGGGVRVAVVDGGIEAGHPDLAANVDASLSRNFVPWRNAPADPAAWNDGDVHGTHVAGTIGARGNNGIGVVGVNWASELFSARACGLSGSCTAAAVAEALAYAGAVGARVANASLGVPPSLAIEAAIAAHPDTLYVVAAGNDGADVDDAPQFPCALPLGNVICVAAIDQLGALAGFSNFGAASVDVGAPGTAILSTAPELVAVFDGAAAAAWEVEPGGRWLDDPETGVIELESEPLPLPAESTLTTPEPLSFAGLHGCQLTHALGLDTTPHEQTLFVEASLDGASWFPVQGRIDGYSGTTGGELVEVTEELTPLDGQPTVHLRYRLRNSPKGQEEGAVVEIGDARVRCAGEEPAGGAYGFLQGTSMASPHVAGIAALAFSAHPGASVAAVREAILSSAVPTASLRGVTATGGRANAAATLAALAAQPAPAPRPGWAIGKQIAKRVNVSRAGRARLRLRCRAARVRLCAGRVVVLARDKRNGRRVVLHSRPYRLAAGRTAVRAVWLRPGPFSRLRDRGLRGFRVRVVTAQPEAAAKQRRVSTRRVSVRAPRR